MSKNYSTDNIYSILGKLDALKPTQEEERFALVKEIRESVEAQGSILEGVDAVEATLLKKYMSEQNMGPGTGGMEEDYASMGLGMGAQGGVVGEKAPPGEKAERMVKHIKKAYAKDGKLTDKEKAIAYATTWAAHNKGQVEEAGEVCVECGMTESDCGCDHTNEAEITRTDGKTVHRKTDYPGYPTDDTEDEANGSGKSGRKGRPRKAQTKNPRPVAGAKKNGRGRPAKPKAPTYSNLADPFSRISGAVPKGSKGRVHSIDEAMKQVEENILSEGRYLEDSAGETLNHILNRFRSEVRNFEQGGDLDNDLYDALFDYYLESGEMPYGVAKARTGDPMRWVAEKLEAELGDIAYGRDPANAEDMEEGGIPGSLPPDQIPGKEDLLKGKGRSYYEEEVTMEDELNELARLAGLAAEGNAFTGKLKDTPKGGSFELDGKEYTDTSTLDEGGECPTCHSAPCKCDDEMEEGNAFTGKLKDTDKGDEFELDGKKYKDTSNLDEGTHFDGEQSDFNISTNMSNDGDKSVTVTATGEHAASLLQMLRIAGLGDSSKAQELQQAPEVEVISVEPETIEMDEEGVEVDQPKVAPQNAPDEKYGTIKNITTQGDDLNREKRQDPGTANKAANPMTNAQQVLKAVAQLESKLAEEYESIKKVNK